MGQQDEHQAPTPQRRRFVTTVPATPHTSSLHAGYPGKRLFDITMALMAFIAAVPVQVVVALSVRKQLGSPVLFRQDRPGLDGELFTLLKFRTMRVEQYEDQPDEERQTRFGNFLRRTSLDELPSLWNVIRGDMSLVGPRPLLPEYLHLYNREQRRRHELRPGLTGWAQVNGRNDVPWSRRFQMDVWYVDNVSFTLDLRILLKTCIVAVSRRGIVPAGANSMPRFQGETSRDA